MIYTPMTKLAMKVCFVAHKDQVDSKAPERVAKYRAAIRLLEE